MSSTPIVSIIIPAHNEESQISMCLEAIRNQDWDGQVEVIVVPNGCTDATGEIARDAGARVITLAQGSKSAALNAGDREAAGFPRFYLDADIRLYPEAIRGCLEELNEGAMAVSPSIAVDDSRASWAVRAYYRYWIDSNYFRRGHVGSGCYVLSQRGRHRFDEFPDIIADDGFVDSLFACREKAISKTAVMELKTPETLWNLIKIKTRARLGELQLRRLRPPAEPKRSKYNALCEQLVRGLGSPRGAIIFGLVRFVAHVRAARQLRLGQTGHWERDESARVGTRESLAGDDWQTTSDKGES